VDYTPKEKEFKAMLRKLVRIAEDDGIITSSEAELLNDIRITVEKYQEALTQAEQDNVITDDEYLVLKNIEDSILQKTFILIEQDEKLDQDSRKMVEKLFDVLMNIL